MLSKLRLCKAGQDEEQVKDAKKTINFHEEYHKALRTKSYADFFNKVQLLANQPSIYSNQNKFSETLLEPHQETIISIVNSTILSKKPELKNLMLSYFDISAEASLFCSHLLKSINQVQCNYQFIQRALDIMNDDDHDDSPDKFKQINFELNSFILSNNPFSNINNHDFKLISDKHSLILHQLKSFRQKVRRKIKPKNYLKKRSGICITKACGLVIVTATVIATHTLIAPIMSPAFLSFPCKSLKWELIPSLRSSKSTLPIKVCDQLDIAAKGTYILNRDFDTMSRLVARLHDEIEHNRTIVQFCLDRKDDKFCLQIMKELKKSYIGFRKLVEELEEHVYLCLVTINRARSLVIKGMKKTCTEGFGK